MTAIRLEVAGAGSFVISNTGSSFLIQSDKEFLTSMCKPHTDTVEFFSIRKIDTLIFDRFESDEEMEATHSAFIEMWSVACHGKEVSGEMFYNNLDDFNILCNYCRAFDKFMKGENE